MRWRHCAEALLAVLMLGTACTPSAGFVGDPRLVASPSAAATTVTIMRISQMMGSAGRLKLSLDGKEFAYIGPGDYVQIQVEPGDRYLFVGEGSFGRLHVLKARAGVNEYFRIVLGGGDEVINFQRLAPEDGEKELRTGDYEKLQGRTK